MKERRYKREEAFEISLRKIYLVSYYGKKHVYIYTFLKQSLNIAILKGGKEGA